MTTQPQQKTNPVLHVTAKDLGITAPKKATSAKLFAVWVRTLLQNWRQGTVGVKGRSDVSYSNKKPWKQKGTGRARAGSARSPVWRGGGVSFGPQMRVRKLTLPQQMKKQVLIQLVADRIKHKQLVVAEWQLSEKPSTKQASQILALAGLTGKKVTVFLPAADLISFASFVNIPYVQVLFFDQANAYDLANSHAWLILKKDFEMFKDMVGGWQ
jgi:large subunit ribosomal protein L4